MNLGHRSSELQWSAWVSITSITFVLVRARSVSTLHVSARKGGIFAQDASDAATVMPGEHHKMFPFCSDESGAFGWIPISR